MLSELTLDHQAVDKHPLNHVAERATQPDAAALPLPDFLRNLHSTEGGLSSEPDRYSQTKDMASELSR